MNANNCKSTRQRYKMTLDIPGQNLARVSYPEIISLSTKNIKTA
jgi:hypothetical protein